LSNQANLVLAKIPGVTGSQVLKDEFRGQLLALRAIAHFHLLRAYGGNYNPSGLGVPYNDYNDIFRTPARLTMQEVLTRIDKDLDEAMNLLPSAFTFSDIYINRTNIAAFRARIALYRGDYRAAVDYANTAIAQSNRPLANTQTLLNNMWNRQDDRTRECLFTVRYEFSAAIGGLWGTSTGDIYIAPSTKLVASLNANVGDFRRNAYLNATGNPYVFKYRGSSRGSASNPDNRVVDMKVIRTAEMFLIRAEAFARMSTPNLDSGMINLNLLRASRFPAGQAPVATGLDQTALLGAILEERFKELCFEGARFWDLRRFEQPVNRHPSDANTAWRNLPKGDFRFVLPIPFDEMLVNPNMKQNPGYN
jgi:starch-binding outer membrane protein, SusD/RagB family